MSKFANQLAQIESMDKRQDSVLASLDELEGRIDRVLREVIRDFSVIYDKGDEPQQPDRTLSASTSETAENRQTARAA